MCPENTPDETVILGRSHDFSSVHMDWGIGVDERLGAEVKPGTELRCFKPSDAN